MSGSVFLNRAVVGGVGFLAEMLVCRCLLFDSLVGIGSTVATARFEHGPVVSRRALLGRVGFLTRDVAKSLQLDVGKNFNQKFLFI